MNISDQDRVDLFTAIFPIIMSGLAAKAGDQEVTADDIIEFFGLGISTILDNDTNLTTPRLRRLALETVSKRLAAQVASLKLYQEEYGQSLLSVLLAGPTPQGTA